jgi:hypothetical protein
MLKLSNFWEQIDETISFIVDKPLKAKYTSVYDTRTGKLKISELDFLKMLVRDYCENVQFRFLFDYEPGIKREIIETITRDADAVVNRLMVDLNGQLNIHDVPFAGADEVEDVERYRELDERVSSFKYGSTATSDILWITDWLAAYEDEGDEPDIKALEAIYRRFLRVTGYSLDYEMVEPKVLLANIKESNRPDPSLRDTVEYAVETGKYGWLKQEADAMKDSTDQMLWLMQFLAEKTLAEDRGSKHQLSELYEYFTTITGLGGSAEELVKKLEK